MHVKFCPELGCDYASSCSAFCLKHGLELKKGELKPATNYFCPKCGAMRFEEDKFCGICGAGRRFLFVFRPLARMCSFFIITDREEVAWRVLEEETYVALYHSTPKREFSLFAKIEVPL